jgi:hypothetical protein
MKTFLLQILLILACITAASQTIIDACFESVDPVPSFPPSPTLGNFDADLLEWTGTEWIGQWPAANVTIPPMTGQEGCRAMWIGDAISWTTGGEGFAMLLELALISGQTYAINFLYVSDGNSSDGAFAPTILSNDMASMTGANTIGNLPSVGFEWTINTLEFTATELQAGDEWLIVTSAPEGSSGLIGSWCEECGNVQGSCEFELGGDLTLCPGDSTHISVTLPGVSFEWQDGSAENSLYASEPGIYWVQASSNECSFTDSIEVFLFEPTIYAGPDFAICPNDTTNLEASGGIDYLWSNGLGSDQIVEIHPDSTTTYFLTGSDENGCIGQDTIVVIVHPEIPVNILGFTQAIYCLEDLLINISGDPVGGSFQGAGISGNNFNPVDAGIGTHTIIYTFEDPFGCKHDAQEEITVELCDFIAGIDLDIQIFPVPTNDKLTIKWNEEFAGDVLLRLLDARGRQINIPSEKQHGQAVLDIGHLAAGIYRLVVRAQNGLGVFGVVKR